MIDFVKGTLVYRGIDYAVVQTGGLGLKLGMSSIALSELPMAGEEVTIMTYLSVKEDDLSLFGFITEEERTMFERLIGVSGIGPKAALSALSTFRPSKLAEAIAAGDVKQISTIPGVGKKTAQRVILELKGSIEETLFSQSAPEVQGGAVSAASSALLGMGFTSEEARLALEGYDGSDESEALRFALKRLGTGR